MKTGLLAAILGTAGLATLASGAAEAHGQLRARHAAASVRHVIHRAGPASYPAADARYAWRPARPAAYAWEPATRFPAYAAAYGAPPYAPYPVYAPPPYAPSPPWASATYRPAYAAYSPEGAAIGRPARAAAGFGRRAATGPVPSGAASESTAPSRSTPGTAPAAMVGTRAVGHDPDPTVREELIRHAMS